jgi:hypothetical protein
MQNSPRLASSKYKHVRANTIGIVNCHIFNSQSGSNIKLVSSYWLKFAALRLFVETMPIYQPVATGNRNKELYREMARSTWKNTMQDYSRITVFILTPLIFRYHLHLRLKCIPFPVFQLFWSFENNINILNIFSTPASYIRVTHQSMYVHYLQQY